MSYEKPKLIPLADPFKVIQTTQQKDCHLVTDNAGQFATTAAYEADE